MKAISLTWNNDRDADDFLAIYNHLIRFDSWTPGQPVDMKRTLKEATLRIAGGDNERSGNNDTDTGGRNIVRGA